MMKYLLIDLVRYWCTKPLFIAVVLAVLILVVGIVLKSRRTPPDLPGPPAQKVDFRFVPGHFGPRYPYHPAPPPPDRWWEFSLSLPGGIADDEWHPLPVCQQRKEDGQ